MKLILENWRSYRRNHLLLEGSDAAAFEAEMENFMDTAVQKLATIKVETPQEKKELEEVAVITAVGIVVALPKIIQMIGAMAKWMEPKLKKFIGRGGDEGEAKVGNAILAFGDKVYSKYLKPLKYAIKQIGKGVGANWDEAEVDRYAGFAYHTLIALLFVHSSVAWGQAGSKALSTGSLNLGLIKNLVTTATRGESLVDYATKILDK
tara:strand:- start:3667 stop:4287 length:621 start_codon:yes stop_codon:yes gene_type:complete